MFKRVAIPLAVVAVVAAAALGSSSGPKITTGLSSTMGSEPAEPASSHTEATPPSPASAQVADTATEPDFAASVDAPPEMVADPLADQRRRGVTPR